MALNSELIAQCVEEYYKSEDRISKLVRFAVERLEAELKRSNIRARVSGRTKTQSSLRTKLEKWQEIKQKSTKFKYPRDVFRNVGDLAAVRVMTYLERDREKVVDMAKRVFKCPTGESYDIDVKENDMRIKGDADNHYRATHMQLCILDEDLNGSHGNLKGDHFELQVTSMLAHVWNEIEHDIRYKDDRSAVSRDEVINLNSLGLLAQCGDNIIFSLMQANSNRIDLGNITKNTSITSEKQLIEFLASFYELDIDLRLDAKTLLAALHAMGVTSQSDIVKEISPKLIANSTKEHYKRFSSYLNRNGIIKPELRSGGCDIILLGFFIKNASAIAEIKSQGKGPKPRHIALAKHYCGYIESLESS